MKWILFALAPLLFAPSVSSAATNKRQCDAAKVLFNKVALDGAAGTRTKILTNLQGYDKIRLSVQYTWVDNGTLTFAITSLPAKAANATTEALTTYVSPSTASCASGTCTLTLGLSVVTPTLTAATDFDFYLDLDAETALTFVLTESSAASGEFATVTVEKCVTGGQ